MHRCYIEPERWQVDVIEPSADEAHHLRHVLRAEDGDAVAVFDGEGLEARAIVRCQPGGQLLLDVQSTAEAAQRPFELILIQAIPKGSRMDLIVEKATELGIARLVPVVTDRVIVRLNADQARKRGERWSRVAKSAAKQCGTQWMPEIEPVQTLAEALEALPGVDAVLLGSLVEGVQPLHVTLESVRATPPKSIAVIIGPEGDLTPTETQAALAAGALPVSFGDLTLRAETAALYALSVLSYEFLWR
ncbi:MAG: 16S rRNA (uracil(1498)-N(3))-methyltransferase [Verrucomicrobia bacterium]|jgi:16S rRNA (uracil1498-N3)-methyltransferase|nr:16S rRNA (uracil(1498)-N(3))-methyltransferase [Verrucomicrobiota bacterium]